MKSSPLKLIRKHCSQCGEEGYKDRQECPIVRCPLYPYRNGKRPKPRPIGLKPPLRTIRLYCLDCMGGNRKYVTECHLADCLFFPFRFGKSPFSRRGKQKQGDLLAAQPDEPHNEAAPAPIVADKAEDTLTPPSAHKDAPKQATKTLFLDDSF